MAEVWLSTTKTAKKIGIRAGFLRDNRLKLFRAGHHYKLVNPTAYRPTYKWHVTRCDNLLKTETVKAAKLESSQKQGKGVQLTLIEDVEPYEIW